MCQAQDVLSRCKDNQIELKINRFVHVQNMLCYTNVDYQSADYKGMWRSLDKYVVCLEAG